MTAVDDLVRFLRAVNVNSATDLRHDPPASRAAIERCESLIGLDLPRNLRQVYEFANGGVAMFVDYWFSVERLPGFHAEHMRFVDEERQLFGRAPGPQGSWVCFLGISPEDVVVECGPNGEGGRVWRYIAEEPDQRWTEAAPSLEAFVAAHADLAEAGLIEANPKFGGTGYVIEYTQGTELAGYQTPAGETILARHQVTLPL